MFTVNTDIVIGTSGRSENEEEAIQWLDGQSRKPFI